MKAVYSDVIWLRLCRALSSASSVRKRDLSAAGSFPGNNDKFPWSSYPDRISGDKKTDDHNDKDGKVAVEVVVDEAGQPGPDGSSQTIEHHDCSENASKTPSGKKIGSDDGGKYGRCGVTHSEEQSIRVRQNRVRERIVGNQ